MSTVDNGSLSDSSEEEEKRLESFPKDLSTATALKEAGNGAFKRSDFVAALARYDEGIQVLKPHVANDEAKPMLASLYGNCSMVHTKNSAWSDVIASCGECLKLEGNNVKSLFRRGVAYKNVGALDDAKADLSRVLALDEANTAASKELSEVGRMLKEHKQKEKSTFSSMFAKSMYADREQERAQKARREEDARLKDQDDWTKSKLDRRSKGLEEQTFEDWKKEQDEKKKADQERPPPAPAAEADRSSSSNKETKTKVKPSTDSAKDEEEEYDEEESKIIAETKAKGYCYFRNELSSEVKTLIGDITPKTLAAADTSGRESDGSLSQAPPAAGADDNKIVAASSWNTAGTWEEKEMTQEAKDRLTAFCLEARAAVAGGLMDDPQNLTSTLDALSSNTAGGAADSSAGALLEKLEASMGSYSARVTKAKSITGDAQIVLARGKKRHIYDFNVELEFEVVMEMPVDPSGSAPASAGAEKKKPKKFKGVCILPEVAPSPAMDGAGLEIQITYSKPVSPAYTDKINKVNELLRADLIRRIISFETEFKSM